MLIKCPECELQASDKAIACPHCGFPFQPNITVRKTRKTNRKRRLPNGFGQISEIKGKNLRNPFRAMITVGKTETGRPICELLKPKSYFPTYNDAYTALVEYNRNPYDLDKCITMEELYDKWSSEYYEKAESDATIRSLKSAWAYCSDIYSMPVSEVRIRHIKGCMENGKRVIKDKERTPSAHVKSRIKSVINLMLDYAVEYEIVKENYSRSFKTPTEISKEKNKVKKEHIAFTDEELGILWSNLHNMKYVSDILIQAYSGWRPQELGLIERQDVDLENWTFKGGLKTDAGQDRTVPIHTKIRPLVEAKYKESSELNNKYLLTCTDVRKKNDLRLTYSRYQKRFGEIIEALNLNPEHRTHDPRKTFVTNAKKYKVDEYAIKYIVGHEIDDITEKVYTERDIEWLRTEIEKIK